MPVAHVYALMNSDDHSFLEAIGAELEEIIRTHPIDRGRILGTLSLLRSSMLLHFSQEEEIMKRYNYPGFFHHKFSHDYIAINLSVFISSFRQGHDEASRHVWPALKLALDKHVCRYDTALKAFLDDQAGIALSPQAMTPEGPSAVAPSM